MQPSATGRASASTSPARISMFNLHYQANGQGDHGQNPHRPLARERVPSRTHRRAPVVGDCGSETFIVNGKELTGRFTAQVTQDILPPGLKTVPNIPAGADNYRSDQPPADSTGDGRVQHPAAHAPARQVDEMHTAVYPDGREEELLNVPHYDFNWQIVYEFAKPVTLPAGTTVRVEAAWDNSTKNKLQPEAGPGGLLGRAELGRDAQPDHPRPWCS